MLKILCIRIYILSLLISLIICVEGKSKNGKTSKENANHEDSVKRTVSLDDDPSLWPGHLKPLGSFQRIHKVDTYKKYLSPEEFLNNYAAPYLPVLFQAVEQTSQSCQKWGNITYFKVLPQSLTHWIHISPDIGDVSFRKYLLDYADKGVVYDQAVPHFLRDDVSLPKCLHCEPIINSLSQHRLWISHKNNASPLQRRNKDSLHCTLVGKQTFTLISHIEHGDKVPVDYANIDVDKVNFTKHPSLREVEYHQVQVKAGDCIFIPTKWYYQVRSYGKIYTVNIDWYHRNKAVKPTECKTKTPVSNLNSVTFKDVKDNTTSETDVLLHYFTSYLLEVPKFTGSQFERHVKKDKRLMEDLIEWTEELKQITNEVFEVLDVNKDKKFSILDLEALTPAILEDIRGLFTDRIQDYDDILKDQQEEFKESQKKIKPEGKVDDASKAGMSAVDDYLKGYIGQLEDVLKESIEEMSVTGQLPDIKQKFAERQAKGSGKSGRDSKQSDKTKRKSEREKERERIQKEREKDKDKIVNEAKQDKKKTAEDENYIIVDEAAEEEIFVDNDDDIPREQKSNGKGKQPQNKKDSQAKEASTPKSKSGPTTKTEL